MNDAERRWVLAFDASCATCRQISDATTVAAGDRLEVLPLAHPDVRGWLAQAASAKDVPTLLAISGDEVRAWTGPRMGIRLARRLGPRPTMRVLRALGDLRRHANGRPLTEPDPSGRAGIGRAQVLRIGAGAVIAAGIVLAGKAPAFADQSCAAASAWVSANRDRLPETYDEIIRYPMVYRRAIYSNLSPAAKSRFWVTHLVRYRDAHPEGSEAQNAHIGELIRVADRASSFTHKPGSWVKNLSQKTIRLFGSTEAGLLAATLGPATSSRPAVMEPQVIACECSDESDYCDSPAFQCSYRSQSCQFQDGCGFLGFYVCNGLCVSA